MIFSKKCIFETSTIKTKQMKIISRLIFLFIIVFSGLFMAQKTTENTLLWKITGKNVKKPSYLFGTFHLLCNNQYNVKDNVKKAIDASDYFVMEINFSDPNELMEMQKMLVANKKITEGFSEDETRQFSENLNHFGYKIEDVENFSPIALYSMLTMKFANCAQNDLKMIDLELMQLALKQNKKVIGLETTKLQTAMFEKFLSKEELIKLVSDFDKGKKEFELMQNAYVKENLAEIKKLMDNPETMSEEQKKIMLTERNNIWLERMMEMIPQNSSFFAVGAAHLLGDDGMIALLRGKGYTVEPVFK